MSLAPIATDFVVPPLNLFPVGVAGLALAAFGWRRSGLALAAVAILGLIVLGMPVVSSAMIAKLERGLPLVPDPADPPQAIVILGAEQDTVRTPEGPAEVPGPLSLQRERAGAELARLTGLPVLVTGGTLPDPVGAVMARSLRQDFGIVPRWVELRSSNTWQNAQFSAPILRAAGIHSVYVVTHAWHMKRALQSFAPTGLRVTAAPVQLDLGPDLDLDSLVPSTAALRDTYFAFHEWIGRAWYAVHYRHVL